jgi:hypothetical protein
VVAVVEATAVVAVAPAWAPERAALASAPEPVAPALVLGLADAAELAVVVFAQVV